MKRLAPNGGEWGNENCLKPIASLLQTSVVIYKNKLRQPLIFGEEHQKECLLYLDPDIPHYFVFFRKLNINAAQICKRYPGVIKNSDYSKERLSSFVSSGLVRKTNLALKKNLNVKKSQRKINSFFNIHEKEKHSISKTTNEKETNMCPHNKKMKLDEKSKLEKKNRSSNSCYELKYPLLHDHIVDSEKTK